MSLETLVRLIWRTPGLRNIIRENHGLDAQQRELLYQILTGVQQKQREELTQNIYRYGSMVKEQDIAARQIFLWLLMLIWEMELES